MSIPTIPTPAGQPGQPPWRTDATSLYQRLLPEEFFDQARAQAGIRENQRVYRLPVVLWLMISQRLQGNGSLESAVLELLRGLPASFWPRPCKRLQDWQRDPESLSSRTGAYNKARQAVPLKVIEQSCDRIFQQLAAAAEGTLPPLRRRAFFFDGTTVRLPHSEALCRLYPPGSNQHGESHWPLLRMLVAHDLQSGLAMRPEWGPMHGPQSLSEQQLLEAALGRLPSGAVVVGDANFGVFSVAYAAVKGGHPLLLRLTAQRAKCLAGEPLRDGIDRVITWWPSREDRNRHPGLPPGACVRGRLLVCLVQPSNGAKPLLLALFTTLCEDDQQEILQLYGQRWNIETDLRSLKSTLQLDQLSCTTPEMVAKELDLAMAAYNLIRAIACLAAQQSGIPPRRYSFTRVQNVVRAFAPLIAAAPNRKEGQKHFDRMMYYVGQATLPKRKRPRPSYPRTVWSKGEKYPNRKA